MKKKKNIYFLVPAVVLIWGFIGYKIVKTIHPNDEMKLPENSLVAFIPDKIKDIEKFTIKANYRDPFLGKLFLKKIQKNKGRVSVKIPEPEIIFPKIIYNGMIAPKEPNRATLFILTINNQQQFLSVGKQLEGIKLLKGTPNEITISFKSIKKTISIQ